MGMVHGRFILALVLSCLAAPAPAREPDSFDAPHRVSAGELFDIRWMGPVPPTARVAMTALDRAALSEIHALPADAPLTLIAPLIPGRYALHYLPQGLAGPVRGDHRFVVEPPMAGLVALEIVPPGQEFGVGWDGPANPANSVELIDTAADGAIEVLDSASVHLLTGIVTLTAPDRSGTYTLRLIGRDGSGGSAILATRTLSVSGY